LVTSEAIAQRPSRLERHGMPMLRGNKADIRIKAGLQVLIPIIDLTDGRGCDVLMVVAIQSHP